MAPVLRETGQLAVRQAARQSAVVYRAVTKGPPSPAPAGFGVDRAAFQSALPWLRWKELDEFATIFGQRRYVVPEIAAELASEVGRRLGRMPSTSEPSAASFSSGAENHSSEAARLPVVGTAMSEERKPWEVASVMYQFSKLTPQLPEYAALYTAVADGIQRDAWAFSRLQRGLVGTAFADANLHTADALPAVLKPALRSLREDISQVTADEVRYLVHACSHLPGPEPALSVEDVEALSDAVSQVVREANFSQVAHIVMGWLRIGVPLGAKAAYFDALRVACVRLHGQAAPGETTIRPAPCAHPLPVAGFAPALEALLAREGSRDPPPLTPPRLRDVVLALVQMSRGILSISETRARERIRSDALSLGDWTKIMQLTYEFCEGHGPTPGWSAQALGFVVSKAPLHPRKDDLPQPDALLALLRLSRTYRPKPAPTEHLFDWVAEQLIAHKRKSGDSAVLAECVRELVPCLAEPRRHEITQLFLEEAQGAKSDTEMVAVTANARRRARPLLTGRVWRTAEHPGVALQRNAAVLGASEVSVEVGSIPKKTEPRVTASRLLTRATANAIPGGRLWGMLTDDLSPQEIAQSLAAASPLPVPAKQPRKSVHEALAAQPAAEANLAASVSEDVEQINPVPLPSSGEGSGETKELRDRLEKALRRVETLESRLEERLQEMDEKKAAEPIPSPSMQSLGHSSQLPSYAFPSETAAPSVFSEWAAQEVTPAGVGNLQLHRPFIFEDFRRANSARMQTERLRTMVPNEQVSMWPLPKK